MNNILPCYILDNLLQQENIVHIMGEKMKDLIKLLGYIMLMHNDISQKLLTWKSLKKYLKEFQLSNVIVRDTNQCTKEVEIGSNKHTIVFDNEISQEIKVAKNKLRMNNSLTNFNIDYESPLIFSKG